MKAIPFINAWKECNLISIHKYYDLLSQPFKPETIVELFENWLPALSENSYSFNYGDIIIQVNYLKRFIAIHDANRDLQIAIPQILDDFIRDCQRAGIELTFKQGIVDKLK